MPVFKRLRFLSEYLILRLLMGFFSILSWDTAVKFGAALGRLGIKISRTRFTLATGNIRKAMPELSEQQAQNIALKSWENMGVIAAEVVKAAGMTKKQLLEKCVFEKPEFLLDINKQKKPVLVHMCHMGNWEIAAMAVAAHGMQVCGVARHIRNPYVDGLLAKIRMQFGGEVIFHREPFFSCVRHIKRGKILGILMDQNCPGGEVFIPFFGRMAATTPLTALLSLKTKTPIVPLHVTRRNDGKIVIHCDAPIYPAATYSHEELLKLVEVLNAKLEEWIRQQPQMWLWAHNRWKREKEAPVQTQSN